MVRHQVLHFYNRFSAYKVIIYIIINKKKLRFYYKRVEFLLTNTTSFYQPFNQGIINNVKVYYRKYWLTFILYFTISDRDLCKKVILFNTV